MTTNTNTNIVSVHQLSSHVFAVYSRNLHISIDNRNVDMPNRIMNHRDATIAANLAEMWADSLAHRIAFNVEKYTNAAAYNGGGAAGVIIRFTDDNELAKFLNEL